MWIKKNKLIINQSNNKQNIINKVKTFTIKAKKKNVKNIIRKCIDLDKVHCREVINDIGDNKK